MPESDAEESDDPNDDDEQDSVESEEESGSEESDDENEDTEAANDTLAQGNDVSDHTGGIGTENESDGEDQEAVSEAESNDSEVDGKEYGVNYDPKSQKSLKPYKVLAVSPLWFISNRKLVNMIQGCAIIHLINIPCYNYYIL